MRVSPERWWEYAERDLETARVPLRAQRWDAASLFAQQAAEKAIKALLVQASGELPPRVHDLVRLAELVRMPEELFPELDELSRVYVGGRHLSGEA
jgi:HEPN domain-containing protein